MEAIKRSRYTLFAIVLNTTFLLAAYSVKVGMLAAPLPLEAAVAKASVVAGQESSHAEQHIVLVTGAVQFMSHRTNPGLFGIPCTNYYIGYHFHPVHTASASDRVLKRIRVSQATYEQTALRDPVLVEYIDGDPLHSRATAYQQPFWEEVLPCAVH